MEKLPKQYRKWGLGQDEKMNLRRYKIKDYDEYKEQRVRNEMCRKIKLIPGSFRKENERKLWKH